MSIIGSRLGWRPPRLDLPLVAPRGFSLANVGTLRAPTGCQTRPNFFSIASFATLNMKWGTWGFIDALANWVIGNACLGVIKWLLVTFTSEDKNGLDGLLAPLTWGYCGAGREESNFLDTWDDQDWPADFPSKQKKINWMSYLCSSKNCGRKAQGSLFFILGRGTSPC